MRAFWLWIKREIALMRADTWAPVPHAAFRHDPDAALKVRVRQEEARQRMEKAGVKTLFTGAPSYIKVNPMAAPADAKKVLRIKRGAR